jgi:cellulose synthase (UDP-forming)
MLHSEDPSLPPVYAQKVRNRIVLFLLFTLNVIYLWWRVRYTLPLDGFGIAALIGGIILFAVELFGAAESLIHYWNMSAIETHPAPDVPPENFPHVDVFIATYSEPAELLRKTINGCKYMDYPDKSMVHIYICDDGHRAEIKELAGDMGVHYIDREDHKGAKAGNLNNALSLTTSPLIVTFDADMIPRHKFLMKTVPYFIDEEIKNASRGEKDRVRLGFVQSPQSFYNPDLFQANLFAEDYIPNEQDYFYKVVELARNKSNSVIYGGSNTVISRAALNDIGGFFTGTITEDFATGILLQKKGYTCYAINETLASGLAVDDLKGLINQRARWGRGCIATGRKLHIVSSPGLSIPQKLNYWASIFYWYGPIKKLVYLLSPVMFALFGIVLLKCSLAQILMFWLPKYLIEVIAMRRFSRNIRTVYWSQIYEILLFPFLLIPTVLEFFGVSLKTFKVTRKDKVDGEADLGYLIPFLILLGLSIASIVSCVNIVLDNYTISPAVLLFWLCVNVAQLLVAVLFILGQSLYRRWEWVSAVIPGRMLLGDGRKISCRTKSISETNILLTMEQAEGPAEEFERNTAIKVELDAGRYRTCLDGRFIRTVKQPDDAVAYSFQIRVPEDPSDFYQMLYDRDPSMPVEIGSFFSHLKMLFWTITNEAPGWYGRNRKGMLAALFIVILGAAGIAGYRVLENRGMEEALTMNAGWNLGNSLDTHGLEKNLQAAHESAFSRLEAFFEGADLRYTPAQYETYWGNPKVSKKLIRSIRRAGFDTIRIPVSWSGHCGADYRIENGWMRRVRQVVNYAMDSGFYVIIDTHHEDRLIPDAGHEAEAALVLTALWTQIASEFAAYGDHLIFEGMNEPRLTGSALEWGAGTPEARAVVNRLNALFVETVRKTGGGNASRLLLLDPYASWYSTEALEGLVLPDDKNIGVSIHVYNPRSFAIDSEGTAQWNAANPADTAVVDTLFSDTERLFTSKGIPVIFTETGAGDRGNEDARVAWTRYMKDREAAQRIVPVWWDNGVRAPGELYFGIFNRVTGKPVYPGIIDALTAN